MPTNLFPLAHIVYKRLLRRTPKRLYSIAEKVWEVHPRTPGILPRAYYLPGQLDRVQGWDYLPARPGDELAAPQTCEHAATRALLLRDVALVDGSLYKGPASHFFRSRHRRWLPQLHVSAEVDEAALYCSRDGVQWFGQWLLLDSSTYLLAREFGPPTTLDEFRSPHLRDYEARLGVECARYGSAFFRKLFVFEDFGHNAHRSERFRRVQRRIVGEQPLEKHAGVFILRGTSGARRILVNEAELADRLRARRGFRVIDPLEHDVETILATCRGARVIVGVEGSHMAHAALTAEQGDAFLILQPPTRFMLIFKNLADREGLHFGFVVGTPEGDAFRVDPDEVERTLELLPIDS